MSFVGLLFHFVFVPGSEMTRIVFNIEYHARGCVWCEFKNAGGVSA